MATGLIRKNSADGLSGFPPAVLVILHGIYAFPHRLVPREGFLSCFDARLRCRTAATGHSFGQRGKLQRRLQRTHTPPSELYRSLFACLTVSSIVRSATASLYLV